MIIPRQKGPVAEWVFDNGPIDQLLWPDLERSLNICADIASILMSRGLLIPGIVRLSQWMHAGPQNVAQSRRVDKDEFNMELDPQLSLKELLPLCRDFTENEKVYPLTIEVFGTGTVFTEEGDLVVEDLTWIRATALDVFRVSVGTQSDSWLPFSLKGQPQPRIYELNAGRMVSSLEKIKQNTGFELEESIDTRYSVINGFRLDNIRYIDGSVVDLTS